MLVNFKNIVFCQPPVTSSSNILLGMAKFRSSPTVVGIIWPSLNDRLITWFVVTCVIGMVRTICLVKPEIRKVQNIILVGRNFIKWVILNMYNNDNGFLLEYKVSELLYLWIIFLYPALPIPKFLQSYLLLRKSTRILMEGIVWDILLNMTLSRIVWDICLNMPGGGGVVKFLILSLE